MGDDSTGKTRLIQKFLNVEESMEETQQQGAPLNFEMNYKEIENGKVSLKVHIWWAKKQNKS